METATYELPYDGAKEMLLVEDIDSKEYLTGLNAMYDELQFINQTTKRNRNEARKDKLERGVNLFFKVLCDKHNNL